MKNNFKTILILNHHGLGDTILSIPMIYMLKKIFPFSRTIITVQSKKEKEVLSSFLTIDKYIIFGQIKSSLYKLSVLSTIKNLYRRINILLWLRHQHIDLTIFTQSIKSWFVVIYAFLTNSKIRIGLSKCDLRFLLTHIVKDKNVHWVIKNLMLLESLNIKVNYSNILDLVPPLIIKNSIRNKIDQMTDFKDKKYLAVSPFSGPVLKQKRWPIDKFGRLISLISKKKDMIIFLLGGKEDLVGNKELKKYIINKNVINLVGKLSILEVTSLLSKCDLTIGADIGLMHLSSICGSKTLTLFGPTDYKIAAPFFSRNVTIKSKINCAPCYKEGGKIKCKKPICMEKIEIENVKKYLEKILGT